MKGTVAFCWLIIFIIFVATLNELAKKNKNANDNLLTYIIILVLFFSAPFAWWIISTPSSLGFIEPQHQEAWLGFFGSIIGGALTIFGVWWTLERQEQQRREDLAIQYRPILYFSLSTLYDFKKEIDTTDLIKVNNGNINLYLPIKNIGRGEAIDISFYYKNNYIQQYSMFPVQDSTLVDIEIKDTLSFKDPEENIELECIYYDFIKKKRYINNIKVTIKKINNNTFSIVSILNLIDLNQVKDSEQKSIQEAAKKG